MKWYLVSIFVTLAQLVEAQQGTFKGRITDTEGKPVNTATINLPFVGIIGVTDNNGGFELTNVPVSKRIKFVITAPGYTGIDTNLVFENHSTIHIFHLKASDSKILDEVVVSGSREAMQRSNVAQKIEVISGKMFSTAGALSMGEGLCFSPGLRVETNCQTCNFTQLRMNGLGGDYSQILINSRPLFTGLIGLYGLDQIPPAIIERIEISRGGGSVLYGANAIAGTVNVITKKPARRETIADLNTRLIGGESLSNNLSVFTTLIGAEKRSGLSLNLNLKNQESFDANDDGFSEIPKISGLNIGVNAFKEIGARGEIELWSYLLAEERFGGDNLNGTPEQTTQSEFRRQGTLMAGADYKYQLKRNAGVIRLFASGQKTQRKHYTGLNGADGWGNTNAHTIQGGLQWNLKLQHGKVKHALLSGLEYQEDYTFDEIPAYDYLIDQQTKQAGIYVQDDIALAERWKLSAGLRINKHNFVSQPIFIPRVNIQFVPVTGLNLRIGYARGFKPPQAFETDMHIAFAGGGVSRVVLSPDLVFESSDSYTASIIKSFSTDGTKWEWSLDGFYTKLYNPFVLEQNGFDSLGNMLLLRTNGPNATVYGLSTNGRWVNTKGFEVDAGLTIQRSFYASEVFWSDMAAGEARFLRTPDWYGYVTGTVPVSRKLSLSTTINLTGPMSVPHFGGAPETPADTLIISQAFFDWGLRAIWFPLKRDNLSVDIGMRNILNSYQTDFDTTKYRDSNFVYGPAMPRTFQFGVKFTF